MNASIPAKPIIDRINALEEERTALLRQVERLDIELSVLRGLTANIGLPGRSAPAPSLGPAEGIRQVLTDQVDGLLRLDAIKQAAERMGQVLNPKLKKVLDQTIRNLQARGQILAKDGMLVLAGKQNGHP